MKQAIILISALALLSCKKEGNKAVISSENSTEVVNNNGKVDTVTNASSTEIVNGDEKKSETFTYKGLDGTRAKATFDNDKGKKTLTVQANNNKFQLDFIAENNDRAMYERRGIKAEVKGDSLLIIQDDKTIPLVKVKY